MAKIIEGVVRGFKVLNPDWICMGFKYELGHTHHIDGEVVCCRRGFHFCRDLVDCFNYYRFDPANKVVEIEASGVIDESDDDSKCCTNTIKLVRELAWEEVLRLVNIGATNNGFGNSGDRNSGDENSGSWNFGNWNSGNWNFGDWNSGDGDSGSWNSGDRNTGDWNSGDWNFGDRNSGNRNSGNRNSGNWNSGNGNSGNWNSGNNNSGDWNSGNRNAGCFNTESPKILMFDKPSNWSFNDWWVSSARHIMLDAPRDHDVWVSSERMADEEKELHPEHKVTGGFLRHIDGSKDRQEWWNGLPAGDKKKITSLPNFDTDKFQKCTGIRIEI